MASQNSTPEPAEPVDVPEIIEERLDFYVSTVHVENQIEEPDIDLDDLTFQPNLLLSTRDELRLPLRWIAILRDQVSISLAATSGVHYTEDVLKALLAGADCTALASVLLQRGAEHLKTMLAELQSWLDEKDYESLEQLKGSMSRIRCSDPSELERANYMKALVSYTDAV